MKLTAAQLRAARALAGVSAEQFAEVSGVGVATIRRAEAAAGVLEFREATSRRIAAALVQLGIEVFSAGEEDEGVKKIKNAQPSTRDS